MIRMKKRNDERAILILSDMEGVSGVIDKRLIFSGEPFWQNYGRYLLTEDVNAVASVLYSGGIKKIYLSESHNFGKNTVMEYLLPFVTVLPPHSAQSSMHGKLFWEEIYEKRNIKGAIMVGCHAMEGEAGFLAHSLDSKVFEYIEVNGTKVGEIGLIAGLLGYYNIPLIMVAGDEAAAKEAKKIIPEIVGVAVKRSKSENLLEVLPPDAAQQLIREKTSESLEKLSRIKPFKFEEPVKLSFKVKKANCLVKIANDKRIKIKEKVVRITETNYLNAYDVFWNCYLKMIL